VVLFKNSCTLSLCVCVCVCLLLSSLSLCWMPYAEKKKKVFTRCRCRYIPAQQRKRISRGRYRSITHAVSRAASLSEKRRSQLKVIRTPDARNRRTQRDRVPRVREVNVFAPRRRRPKGLTPCVPSPSFPFRLLGQLPLDTLREPLGSSSDAAKKVANMQPSQIRDVWVSPTVTH